MIRRRRLQTTRPRPRLLVAAAFPIGLWPGPGREQGFAGAAPLPLAFPAGEPVPTRRRRRAGRASPVGRSWPPPTAFFGRANACPDPIALSGLPCLAGRIGAAAAPFRDRVTAIRPLALSPSAAGRPPNRCLPPRLGVPGGLADRACVPGEAGPAPGAICALGGGRAFDLCAGIGRLLRLPRRRRLPAPSARPAATARSAGRITSAIAAAPELAGGKGGAGFCTPTYFLFQMRVDGHPSPRG